MRPLVAGDEANERLGAIHRLLDDWRSEDEEVAATVLTTVQGLLAAAPSAAPTGAELVGNLDFSQLRTFFQARKL
jgi:hypothetical protein